MEAMFAKKKKKGSKKAFSLNVASSKDVKGAVAPPARRDHDDAAVLHSVVKTAADGQDDGWEDGNEKKKAVSTGGKKVAEVAQSADDEVDWNKCVERSGGAARPRKQTPWTRGRRRLSSALLLPHRSPRRPRVSAATSAQHTARRCAAGRTDRVRAAAALRRRTAAPAPRGHRSPPYFPGT